MANEDINEAINYLKSYREMVIKALEQTKWIPVSERLPEIKEHHVSEPCLVCTKDECYGLAGLEENVFGRVRWNCERDDEYHTPLGEVVAWMPLPEPYKAESEDKE